MAVLHVVTLTVLQPEWACIYIYNKNNEEIHVKAIETTNPRNVN